MIRMVVIYICLRTFCLTIMSFTQEKFLTPEWIQTFKSKISSAPLVMVDANLTPPALEVSCRCKSSILLLILIVSLFVSFSSLSSLSALCICCKC